MYVDRGHPVGIMKDERVAKQVGRPRDWAIRQRKDHHEILQVARGNPDTQYTIETVGFSEREGMASKLTRTLANPSL